MLNFLINFCLFIFIGYAVWGSARAIIFGSKRKKRRAHYAHASSPQITHQTRTRKKAQIIRLKTRTAKRPQRKHSSAVALCA